MVGGEERRWWFFRKSRVDGWFRGGVDNPLVLSFFRSFVLSFFCSFVCLSDRSFGNQQSELTQPQAKRNVPRRSKPTRFVCAPWDSKYENPTRTETV